MFLPRARSRVGIWDENDCRHNTDGLRCDIAGRFRPSSDFLWVWAVHHSQMPILRCFRCSHFLWRGLLPLGGGLATMFQFGFTDGCHYDYLAVNWSFFRKVVKRALNLCIYPPNNLHLP